MEDATAKVERLRSFIEKFHDGKQKNLAEAYELSPSVVSGWLNPENDRASVPAYMEKIIEITKQVEELSTELNQTKVGRVVQTKSGFAVVRFADSSSPGTIVCKGVPDLETANSLTEGLLKQSEAKPASEKKER